MKHQISTSFLVVKPFEKHTELLAEYKQLIKVLTDKNIDTLELFRDKDIDSKHYLCSSQWISFQGKGVVAVYPMSSLVRQQERTDLVFDLMENNNFQINDVVDFTEAEEEGFFLEGLGSVVLDHVDRVAYASVSKLCDEELFVEFCEEFEFTPIIFSSMFSDTSEVAHTSSILSISKDFALVGSALVKDKKERKLVTLQLKKSGKDVIYISEDQVNSYVSDIKQVENSSGDSFIVLSKSVLEKLSDIQKKTLEKYGELLVLDYTCTENFGGHSIAAALNDMF
jgi:hypothetical protein